MANEEPRLPTSDPHRDDTDVGRRLASERRRTLARIEAMTRDFDAIVAGSSDSNIDDEHDPEGSTVAFERAQTAALLAQARSYLDQLDLARSRLDAGTYTVCEHCGGSIAVQRLAARPAARTCVGCAGSPPSARKPGEGGADGRIRPVVRW